MNNELAQKLESGAQLSFGEIEQLAPEQTALYLLSVENEDEYQDFMSGDEIDFDALAADLGLSVGQVVI